MSQAVLTSAQADKDVVVFKALANSVRLQIVSFVAASEEGQVSAGQIVERFDLSQPTISHHLRVLREAGVLTTYKTSTFVYYRFAPQLRDAVASVLPVAPAAEPPSETVPVRRTPSRAAAGKKGSAAKASPKGSGGPSSGAKRSDDTTADRDADSKAAAATGAATPGIVEFVPAGEQQAGVDPVDAHADRDDKPKKDKKHKGKKKDKKKGKKK